MRVRQCPHADKAEIVPHLVNRFGRTPTANLVSAVYPGRGEAGRLRRDMVVEQALRDMEDLFLRRPLFAQAVHEIGEVLPVRLVGADILGRVDRIKSHAETFVRRLEAGPIDVGQDHQAEMLLQISQRLDGVRECRPVRDRPAERCIFGRISHDIPLDREMSMHFGHISG
jgi:hypothetical protein